MSLYTYTNPVKCLAQGRNMQTCWPIFTFFLMLNVKQGSTNFYKSFGLTRSENLTQIYEAIALTIRPRAGVIVIIQKILAFSVLSEHCLCFEFAASVGKKIIFSVCTTVLSNLSNGPFLLFPVSTSGSDREFRIDCWNFTYFLHWLDITIDNYNMDITNQQKHIKQNILNANSQRTASQS